MPDVNELNVVDAQPAKGAGAGAGKNKNKNKTRKSSSTSLGAARLQVATQLLAHIYPSFADKGGPGTERLEAALRVADELLALNAKLPQNNKKAKTAEKAKVNAAR